MRWDVRTETRGSITQKVQLLYKGALLGDKCKGSCREGHMT